MNDYLGRMKLGPNRSGELPLRCGFDVQAGAGLALDHPLEPQARQQAAAERHEYPASTYQEQNFLHILQYGTPA